EDQTLVVREPAVAGEKFASKPVDFLVLKRPAAPTLIFEHNDSRQEWWISSATSGSYQFYCPDNPDPGPGDVDWGSVWGHCHFPDITYIRSKADPATHTPNSWIQRLNDHPIDIADMDFGTADYGYPAPEMQKVVIRDNNYYAQQNQLTDWHTSIELADVTKDGKAFAGEAFYLGATTAAELPALTTGQTTDAQYEVGVKAGLTPGIYQANLVLHFDDGFDTTSPGTDDTALGSLTFVVTGKTEWSFGNLSDAVSLTHDGAGLSIKATSGLPADGVAEYSRDLVTWHDPQAELGSDSWDEELGWAQAYTFYVRVAGDDLHNTSAPQLLEEKVYTAFQAPTWAETLRVNYAAETIEFVRGVRAADYAVTAAGEDIAANGSLSAFADAGGGDIVVRRAGAADIHDGPATSAPSTLAVAGRPAPPGPGDVDTANSESNLKATGRITEVSGKAFEYRAKGSDDLWKYVGDGEATDVANGEYEVRYPATETSFGSAALDVQVGADQMIQGKLLKLFGADVTPSEGDGAQGTEYVVSAYVETSTLAVTNADLLVTEGATADSLNASLAPGAETAVDVTVRAGVVLTYYKLKIWRHAQTAELQTLLANIRALETHDIFKGYTADSVHALGLVMDACDTVVADQYATQDAVDAKLVALTTAVADLEPLTPVVSPAEDELAAVRDLVDFATGLNSASYTNESFIALLEKVAAAEALLAEGSPGSDELAQAKDELLNALVHLRYHYTEQVATQVTSVVVKRKKTFQIGGLAYLTSGKTEDLDYESSDPAVATVNASGKVTGKATGTATITASSKTPGVDGNPVTATVAVQVVSKPPSVKKVSADAPKELAPAQQVWLHASWSKASAAPGKVTFATSNKKIVTVDKTGKVTAVGSGTVKIKVKAGSKSKTYSIRVAKLNSVRPTITGQKSVGSLLTAVPGVWGPGAVTLSYQWLRSGKAIAGATQDTYLLQPEDVGKKIQVKVTGSKDGYPSLSATSKQYVKATRG
ncbi:MAG: Ig-like domain-containing protein, partial [Propionibacteriaceae bacterium]|nr:Ig-like domain-containing protein [Propionibacteriaceae bacterium]